MINIYINLKKGGVYMLNKIKKHAATCVFCKLLILFLIGGFTYVGIELCYRGYSHWTMFLLGGLCFVCVGGINNYIDYDMPIVLQSVIASIIITILEYICGYIVNIKLGLNVWDYSQLPFNLNGQICLLFSLIWMGIGMIAIFIDDYIRYKLFDEPVPKYKWK